MYVAKLYQVVRMTAFKLYILITCFVYIYIHFYFLYIYCKSGVGSSEMLIISLVSTKLPKKTEVIFFGNKDKE